MTRRRRKKEASDPCWDPDRGVRQEIAEMLPPGTLAFERAPHADIKDRKYLLVSIDFESYSMGWFTAKFFNLVEKKTENHVLYAELNLHSPFSNLPLVKSIGFPQTTWEFHKP